MRDPVTATREICSLLRVQWEPGMAAPYSTAAPESFRAARKFATTDPKLLRRKRIDARLADKWREILPPQKLRLRTRVLANLFEYELPEEHAPQLPKPARAAGDAPPRASGLS